MRYMRAVGVLIVMYGLTVVGQASAGHMGHRQYHHSAGRRLGSTSAIDGPGRAK